MVSRRQLLKLSALGTASFAAPLAYSASNITMTYNTDNPIGSTSPKDLSDNARNLDLLLLGDASSYPDRKGMPRKSWKGMEVEFDSEQNTRETQFSAFMDASGYEAPVPYASGVDLVRTTQTVTYLGNEYRVKSQFLPLTTTNWVTDESKLKLIGDDSIRQDLGNPIKGASMVKFDMGGDGAIPLDVRSRLASAVYFEDFGARGNGVTDDTKAISRADARAKALGVPLLGTAGRVYRVAQKLQLTSDWVWGNWSKICVEGVGGTVGWGNRPKTTYDGFFGGFIFDAANATNATAFRFAGNHERPKIRGIVLLNTDQYAFGMGALGSSDKNDVVNYLDIDGIHIESFRGNVATSTDYSFGFEFFPGANCKGWRIRNATTYGKILNKFHSCDAIDIDHVNFKASERFDPKSSAYCEINSCDNIIVGDACIFDSSPGNITDHAFMINGTRVPGSLTTNVGRVGAWCRNAALANVNGVTLTDSFRALWLFLSGVSGTIAVGGTIERLTAQAGAYVTKIEATPKKLDSIRFEELSDVVIGRFVISGGVLGDRLDFRGNMKVVIHGALIDCAGSTRLYVVQANGAQCSVTLSLCTLDGGGTLNRPLLAQNNGQVRLINNNLDNLVSSNLLASTSLPLAVNVGNTVNGLKV